MCVARPEFQNILVFDKTEPCPVDASVVSHDQANTAAQQVHQEQQEAGRKAFTLGKKKPPKPTHRPLDPPPPEVAPNEHEASEATNFTMDKIASYFKVSEATDVMQMRLLTSHGQDDGLPPS